MKAPTMSVELLFDKHATEYNRFDKISREARLHENKAACALQYIVNLSGDKSGEKVDIVSYGEGVSLSHPDLDLNAMTEADVVYLLRCGVKYDRENDCLLYRY